MAALLTFSAFSPLAAPAQQSEQHALTAESVASSLSKCPMAAPRPQRSFVRACLLSQRRSDGRGDVDGSRPRTSLRK